MWRHKRPDRRHHPCGLLGVLAHSLRADLQVLGGHKLALAGGSTRWTVLPSRPVGAGVVLRRVMYLPHQLSGLGYRPGAPRCAADRAISRGLHRRHGAAAKQEGSCRGERRQAWNSYRIRVLPVPASAMPSPPSLVHLGYRQGGCVFRLILDGSPAAHRGMWVAVQTLVHELITKAMLK